MYVSQSVLPKQKVEYLSDAEYDKPWSQEKSYKVLKKYSDPRFGDITVLKNREGQVVLVKEKLASSKNEATEDINYLKKRLELYHPHIMKLVAYSSEMNKELCSTTYITRGFYEFPRSDVAKEFSDRHKLGQDFTHVELTHLAYQILDGLHNIHQRSLAHGDIRPQLMGYDKSNNHFEILDRLADISLIEKCQGNHIVNGKDIYLSPELYKKLKGKNKSLTSDALKNDIFALGLILVHLGTGNTVQNIYLPTGEVEHRYLQEHVMNFDLKFNDYNPFLCNLVKTLLQMVETDRPDTVLLFKNMPSYSEFKRSETDDTLRIHNSTTQPPRNVSPHPPATQHFNNHTPTTYVKSTPQPLHNTQHMGYTAPIYAESRVIHSQQRYVNETPKNMQFYNAESYFDANGNKAIRRSYGNETKVEVRRGSPSPSPADPKVIKKRYVMREDGTVVELDPNIDITTDEIRKYFNNGHNEHTIAKYDNMDEAINSDSIRHKRQ